MRKLLFLSAIIFPFYGEAQDIHFSQVINNPLHINPANTGGYDGYERVVLNYRNQWSTVNSPYNTMGFSFDMPMFQGNKKEKAHIGLGLSFFSDKAGDSNFGISQGAISLAGIVPMDQESKLIVGLQSGIGQRSADISNLQWGSQFNGQIHDPTIASGESNSVSSFAFVDLAAGVRYEYKNKSDHIKGWDINRLSIGAAMYHINKPELNYFSGGKERLNTKMVLHFQGEFDLPNTTYSIIPFGAFFSQGSLRETYIGALIKVQLKPGTKITGLLSESAAYAGLQMRLGDAIIPYLMYEFSNLSIGVSFDYNISTLKTVSRGNGGFEISLKYHHKKGALFNRRTGSRIYGE